MREHWSTWLMFATLAIMFVLLIMATDWRWT